MYGPPDLCVEIASDSTRRTDRTRKFERYAHVGVAEYWIVEPRTRTVETFTLQNGAYALLAAVTGDEPIASRVLPDLVLTAAEIFADV